jgi:hypothetical protein
VLIFFFFSRIFSSLEEKFKSVEWVLPVGGEQPHANILARVFQGILALKSAASYFLTTQTHEQLSALFQPLYAQILLSLWHYLC